MPDPRFADDPTPFDPALLRKMITALYLELPESVADSIKKHFTPLVDLVESSVLQPWVLALPLRAQGTLLTGYRGCDLAPKNPLTIVEKHGCSTGEDTPERHLVAYLRWCTLRPADAREIDVPGAWFQSKPPQNWRPSQVTHYPMHWVMHLVHCYEIVGYCHPDPDTAVEAMKIYGRFVRALHLAPESKAVMMQRLTEDRIAKGEVVS